MVGLTDVVAVSAAVGATRSRLAKVAAIAEALRLADGAAEVRTVVAFLSGAIEQGRIGAGWRSLMELPAAATSPTLTVTDVDAAFTTLAQARGSGSAAVRAEALRTLFDAATTDEQRFLRALIAGELRQGALEGVMLDAVAKAADVPGDAVRRAFMLSGRLPETAAIALDGGLDALVAVGLEVGRPVRPMLTSPGSSVAEATGELSPCLIEYKLDGARIQVHKVDSEVRVFTRTLREITDSVPELVALVREFPCRSAVLDGETLALSDDGRPRPFQETQSRFGSTTGLGGSGGQSHAEQVRALLLRPYFFDCLHLDGVDLIDLPLRSRTEALKRAVGEHVIPGVVDPTPQDAESFGAAALSAGHEGVMVKELASTYQAGRRGKAWQKVKPVHTVDLVVIGAEWGHGRRTGMLSNLHLGARDPDGGPPIMVGKTFKGLTDELLRWQTTEFPKHQTESDGWIVHMRPELVVEIALDGVQASTRYPGGVALRFARVVRYRPDKQAGDADSINELRKLLPGAAVSPDVR